jgi:hypothetical protein
MSMIDYKLRSKIFLLISIIIFMYIVKPSIIFKPNGKIREYGLGYDNEGYKKTMYTMQNIILILALYMIISE